MRRIISGSRPASFLMGRVWFNCNQVFSRFWFIFSNPSRVQDKFSYCYSRPDYIFKIFFYYFILYFNIINNYYYYNVLSSPKSSRGLSKDSHLIKRSVPFL